MADHVRRRTRVIVAVTLGVACGVSAWPLIQGSSAPHLRFLANKPLVAELERSEYENCFIYTMQGEAESVAEAARQELAGAIERSEFKLGQTSTLLTVPRIENGRVNIAGAPMRQVLILSGKASVDSHGRITQVFPKDRPWTTVEVREYQRPGLLHTLRSIIRKSLNV